MWKRAFSRGLWVISILFYCMAETVIAGTIVGWGLNNDGETTPPEGTDFTVVAAGSSHCLALKADDSIVGWGGNADGEATPPAGTGYLAIAAGYEHSLALKADGSIVGWGDESEDRSAIPEGNDFIAIADGSFHCLAVKSDGKVVGWGFDLMGQSTPPDGNDFVAVAAGNYHSLALKSDGSVVCWGHDSEGQGTSPDGNDFVAIDAGRNHNVALKKDGSIFCWGSDSDGQASPPGGNDFVAVAAGMWHSLALKKDGSIVCWGRNQYGERTPPKGNDFLAVDGGYYYSVAIRRYGGGSGEPNDPYLIYTAEQMNAIGANANDWDKCFKLIADVNLAQYTGTEFNVIGKFFDPFIGVFDGNNHTVHNFSWSAPGYVRGIGLFGVVGVVGDGEIFGEIRNLHIVGVDVNITSCDFIGALVGFNDGIIRSCSSSGEVLVGQIGGGIIGQDAGGLVGYNDHGIIEDCYSDGTVSGTYDIGGLIGVNHRGVIRASYSLCEVRGDSPVGGLVGANCCIIDKCSSGGVVSGNWGVGGLIGYSYFYPDIGVIKNSFSYAEVYGTEQVGGLIGYIIGPSELPEDIINCYAVGSISGNTNVGGLAGYNDHAEIVNCYSAGIVDGNDFVGGLVGDYDGGSYITCFWDIDVNPDVNGIGNASDPNVVGSTTVEMKQRSTFEDWDFINVWDIGENQTYPYLRRYLAGDVNKDGIVNFLDFAIIAEQWMEEE